MKKNTINLIMALNLIMVLEIKIEKKTPKENSSEKN
jgi:hypothetical protein